MTETMRMGMGVVHHASLKGERVEEGAEEIVVVGIPPKEQ
jgi:hypothetical protein